MTAYAFALVVLVVLALVLVIWLLARELGHQRAENRRLTDRLLNALMASDAGEMAVLDQSLEPGADDFKARERAARELRAVARRGENPQRPGGEVVGMA